MVAFMPRTEETMSVRAFLETLEQRLAACSPDKLRAILRGMAREVSSPNRRAFLGRLEPVTRTGTGPREKLLADIRRLASELKTVMQHAEYWEEQVGWLDEEDSLGPYAKFVPRLAALFGRAEAAFESGDLHRAREAYQELFALLDLEDDYGRGIRAKDLEGVDSREACARYLRAVYETSPPARRPSVLFEHLCKATSWLGGLRPMFDEIVQISTRPLPGQKAFLEDWIAFLRRRSGSDADAWLREAIRLLHGTQGLEQLARTAGAKRPRAYLDWLVALEQEGKDREALAAARIALRSLPAGLPIRAAIADRLCAAAVGVHDQDALRAGRWEAFAAMPDIGRLLDLWEAARTGGERARLMQQAAQHLKGYLAHHPFAHMAVVWEDDIESPAWPDRSTLAHAYLLAGDWKAAHALASRDKVLGWSSSDNAQGLVVTVFLTVLSGNPPEALPGNVKQLWQWALGTSLDLAGRGDANRQSQMERLERAYTERLSETSLAIDAQERLLAWCVKVAQARVRAIVGNQHRRSYGKAAVLLAASTEVLRLRGKRKEADALPNHVRTRFPRHRAFHEELSAALQR